MLLYQQNFGLVHLIATKRVNATFQCRHDIIVKKNKPWLFFKRAFQLPNSGGSREEPRGVRAPSPLFKTKLMPEGPKKSFWETWPPTYLRVWMTGVPPYRKVWIRPCRMTILVNTLMILIPQKSPVMYIW